MLAPVSARTLDTGKVRSAGLRELNISSCPLVSVGESRPWRKAHSRNFLPSNWHPETQENGI